MGSVLAVFRKRSSRRVSPPTRYQGLSPHGLKDRGSLCVYRRSPPYLFGCIPERRSRLDDGPCPFRIQGRGARRRFPWRQPSCPRSPSLPSARPWHNAISERLWSRWRSACASLAYAATCSLGFVAGSRDTGISEHAAVAETRHDAADRYATAKAELATLKGSNPAILERRSELTAIMEKASADKRLAGPAKGGQAVNSQAASIAFVLSAGGWTVAPAAVGRWLDVGTVLFLECAAALSLMVASAFQPKPVGGAPARTLPAPGIPPSAPAEGAVAPPEARPRDDERRTTGTIHPRHLPASRGSPGAGRPASVLPAEVVDKLRQAGRQGQRVSYRRR